MTFVLASGIFLGLLFGASLIALIAVWRGWRPTRKAETANRLLGRGNAIWGEQSRNRTLAAIAVGVVVLIVTHWPVAGLAGGVLVWLWPQMFGAAKGASMKIEQLDALATWTESLRDSIAGAVGLEHAINHTAALAPPVLQRPLRNLDGRLKARWPLTMALAALAEDLDDSSADLVIAALVMNAQLRGAGLVATLGRLATSAREELEMRRKVEESRKSLRRTATIIVGFTIAFATGLSVFAHQYVQPYSTPLGQVMLLVVIGVFAAGLIAIRRAADIKSPERFLIGPDEISRALPAGGMR